MKVQLIVVAALAALSSPALAQNRPAIPAVELTPNLSLIPSIVPDDGYIPIHCTSNQSSRCAPLYNGGTQRYVKASEFALYSELTATNDGLADVRRTLTARADESAAMAATLDFVSPTNGGSNRVGAQAFKVGESSAIGASYTRVNQNFDFGVGLALSGNRYASKVGVGFSW